jgi:hypothetical protein
MTRKLAVLLLLAALVSGCNPAPTAPLFPAGTPRPIPLKFIGTLEGKGSGKVAIFSDGQGLPVYGHEGDIVWGNIASSGSASSRS